MGPILCSYYITYRCNARCIFCDIWRDSDLQGIEDPDVSTAVRNLKDARALGVRFVDFTGGEPLLYKKLPELLYAAKKIGLWTSITTNCLLYPNRAEELSGLVDLLHFSLDSDQPDEHDRLRGVKSFNHVMESIEIAKTLGEKPDLLFTVTGNNFGAIYGLAELAQKQRLILIVNPVFSYFNNDPITKEALATIRRFLGEPYVYVNKAFLRLIQEGGNDIRKPRCRAVQSTIVISPDDCLLLPCFHHRRQSIPLGGRLREVWQGEAVRQQRRLQGRYAFCQGCTINCYFDPSFLYRVDPYLWDSLSSKAKYAVDKYVRQ